MRAGNLVGIVHKMYEELDATRGLVKTCLLDLFFLFNLHLN